MTRAVDQAAAAFEAGDCGLCHEVPGQAAVPRTASCSGCHQWIRSVSADPAQRERAVEVFPLWDRYDRNTRSYLAVPSLEAAMARLDPAWVRTWLADPHDLRPALPETMPVFGLQPADLDAIATAFGAARAEVPATPGPDPARVARGEALFTERGCDGCHSLGARHTATTLPLAPDLAHTRDRLSADMAAAWIEDPSSVSSAATMPSLGLTGDEVLAVRDYVLLSDPGWRVPSGPPDRPVPTTRAVSWTEVEERVFGRICVHCHMDPAQNEGRGGPGYDGGFGWSATGIALQTRDQVVAVGDRLEAVLMRRRDEAARDVVHPGQRPADLTRSEIPGMPLGLPPLSDDDISLVLGWLEQGAPP